MAHYVGDIKIQVGNKVAMKHMAERLGADYSEAFTFHHQDTNTIFVSSLVFKTLKSKGELRFVPDKKDNQ